MATGPQRDYLGRAQAPAGARAAEIDVGLRAYMQKVFGLMAGGTAVTGLVAYFTAQSPAMLDLIVQHSAALGGDVLAPLVLRVGVRLRSINRCALRPPRATVLGVLRGDGPVAVLRSSCVYTGQSIARTFFIAAATFAGMALYGYTTKRDLTGHGARS